MIVFGAQVATFIETKIGYPLCEPFAAIGVEQDGKIISGVGFTCWAGADIHLTVAAEKGCVSRSLMRAAARYAFDQVGCVRATVITESPEIADLGKRAGATFEGLSRNQFGVGRDGFRLAFHRDGWRY